LTFLTNEFFSIKAQNEQSTRSGDYSANIDLTNGYAPITAAENTPSKTGLSTSTIIISIAAVSILASVIYLKRK
jgi:hypothetical protein